MNVPSLPHVMYQSGDSGDPSTSQSSIHVLGSKHSWKLEVRSIFDQQSRFSFSAIELIASGSRCFGSCTIKWRRIGVHFVTNFMISRFSAPDFSYCYGALFRTATFFLDFYVNPPTFTHRMA